MARSHRALSVMALAISGGMLASSCTTSGSGEGANEAGTVNVAFGADPATFDPAKSNNASDYLVDRLLYENLVRREDGGKVVPALASAWKADARKAEFTLRDDVTCSDGSKLTPAIVAKSLTYLAAPETASGPAKLIFGPGRPTITADDAAGTVTVTTAQPWSDLLAGLAAPSAGIACSADAEALKTGKAPGTGPYTLKDAQRGSRYTFQAREGYAWGPKFAGAPKGERPKSLVAQVVNNESTRANQLTTKALDMAFLTGPDGKRFTDGDAYKVESAPAVRMYLMFNERAGHPGADEKVRRAIAQAVDRKAFDNAAGLGRGELLTSVAESTVPCVSKDESLLVKPDTAAAGKVLKGMKIKVAGTNGVAGGAGNSYVQAALRAAGADVTLRNTDSATWSTEVLGNQGDWDVNVMAHLNVTLTMTNPASLFAGEPAPKGRNVGGVKNPAFEKGMGAALATTDEAAKCEAWAGAQKALLDRVDAVPLSTVNTTYVFGKRVDAMLPGGLFDISTLVVK
ncbi:ABC transporter substrate-binding protein [Actinomadura sp. 9N407]|uniref:ABC transporter substrate-binding protein n=1 Tax=Actinomadura sp. 9N407 TaxID=3375154 RepID=UPI0037ACE304